MYLWANPLQVIICAGYLIYIAGIPSLVGVATMILMIPLASWVGSFLHKIRKKLMKTTDTRISAINELLQGIRIVKFFAWEQRFAKKIATLRDNELSMLWVYVWVNAAYRVLWQAAPVLVSFSTFASMTWFSGNGLDISTAFTCLSILQNMQRPLLLIPDIAMNCLEALVSYSRIKEFLDLPELPDYVNLDNAPSNDEFVQFISPSGFKWYGETDEEVSKSFSLSNIALSFPKKGLSVIYGTTGSGKSALLHAILGELYCTKGGVHLMNSKLPKTELPIAYASQHVWLQNATIKDNILFGCTYDEQRYLSVIKQCALRRDLIVLEGGDMTEVGEKGVNLSGGQKARIGLARALYSSAAIILMDDPLSAVDAPTAKHIFDRAINGPLMNGRTRILVTHAVHLCAPKANLLIEMRRGIPFVVESPERDSFETLCHQKQDSANVNLPLNNGTAKQLIEAESRMKGNVKLRVYWLYCRAAGGVFFIFFL
jgi:ABC-type multidrug transport system fused ATPase/permease subunit